MKGFFYLLIVAATVVQAIAVEDRKLNITCIAYYPECPQEENATSIAVHLADPENCHQFYKCQHGGACIFPCPWYANGTKQLVFDPQTQVCDFQFNVNLANCTAEVTPTPAPEPEPSTTPAAASQSTSETVQATANSTKSPITQGTPVSSTEAATESSTEAGTESSTLLTTLTTSASQSQSCQPNYACPSTGVIRVKHETDCSYYYNCINGLKKLVKCPNSLVFNCNAQYCDYPKNYNCKTIRPVVPY